ncbi:hypothetical protein PAF17_18560 [Paracoccus sp. Z330]|uniref:Uncharacterized protein n=1 Tax=Paracoccus onchidii TaxID=3017813 RepID=A0ABT4ZJF0_9RHOB|nr:hypothetical protein [Paracoccus onchidii]MDB6179488.1 hypothetical protein [Paracoccus onchidii]
MIEAVIGFVGVIIGSFITVAKEVVLTRLERKRNGTYSAMRVVCELDHFVDTCVGVVCDDGTVEGFLAGKSDDGHEYAAAQVECPKELTFADDIDWKSIGGGLMYRALALPNRLAQANRFVDFWGRTPSFPYLTEYFEARQESYSELGMEALALAADLRGMFGIPPRHDPNWKAGRDPKAIFQETLSKFQKPSKAESTPMPAAPQEGTK